MKGLKTSLLLVFGLVTSLAFAQMGMHQGMGQGMHQAMRPPVYDPSTVTTVKGTITEVRQGTTMRSMMNQQSTMMNRSGNMMGQQGGMMNHMGRMATRLLLQTENGILKVIVGPSSYLTEKNFSFARGDQIEVTGSKVKFQGHEELIARDIKKGGRNLTLRNDRGIPLWSKGWRSPGTHPGA